MGGGLFNPLGPVLAALYRPEEESGHRRIQESQWYQPLVLQSNTLDSRLSLAKIHRSCNKACAIYCIPKIHIGMSGFWRGVYDKWFIPNNGVDIEFGTFFAHFIACWYEESPNEVEAILEVHERLCRQVEKRQGVLDEIDKEETERFKRYHKFYELGLAFRSVFIIVDKPDWKNEGVLLVRTGDAEGLRKWPIGSEAEKIGFGAVGDGRGIARLSLEKAMEVVLGMYHQSESETQTARRLKPNDPPHVCVY
ncbi:hypothetical protein ONS95_013466 [Cadophora gregata]|uniref:uncharacterized protein n=1 Tax=Cadophora gregata TaxID=51156 RepID=UPI0026DC7003|nr:uncharacterized protein ONS95_013466 [Cadophora gregata]KAK0099638.1 hypothetical protein ONS96_008137 [Cadophora gregata f. sp. sojae]KAK0116451.1 hypothetical protein ONS95_013466 [Cadophora gregata]